MTGPRLAWLLLLFLPVASRAQPAPRDSIAPAPTPAYWRSPSDSTSARGFLSAHSFSLDHFMEFSPGLIIERRGPIGAQATYSRYGIGRGRGSVYLGVVEMNDPQDGSAPLALVPTTAIGTLIRGSAPPGRLFGGRGIEGGLRLVDPEPAPGEPMTAFDVSKGESPTEINRRARFSSAPGRFGVDFSYDELRSNGYDFDARGFVQGRDYGRSATRVQSGGVRGIVGGERYNMTFRDFESSFQGDENSVDAEYRRSGFIASVETTVKRFDAALYARSYRVSAPDSTTNNTTTAVRANVPLASGKSLRTSIQLAYDDVVSTQRVGGGSSEERLQVGEASINGVLEVSPNRRLAFNLDGARQFDNAAAWGAGAAFVQRMGSHYWLTLHGSRRYRLPSLGELFLPLHAAGSGSVVGNRNLDAEGSLEAGLQLQMGTGRVRNDLRGTALRVKPILPIVVATTPYRISPRNLDAQSTQIIEDCFEARGSFLNFDYMLSAGAQYSFGGGDGYFEGVPQLRASSGASLGRDLFRNTSGLVLTGEYVYCTERRSDGHTLPSYGVFNLKLDVRLVEFRAYALLLNVFDEQYQTAYPFLMTPTTFVYGATWLFNS